MYLWMYVLFFKNGKTKTGIFSTPTDFLKGDTEVNALSVCASLLKDRPKLILKLKRYMFRSLSENLILEVTKDIHEARSRDRFGDDGSGI